MTLELERWVAPKPTSAPGSPTAGELWYDPTSNLLKWYSGSAWITANSTPAFTYNYLTSTTNADPSSGNLKFNNATLSSATTLYISETDASGSGISAFIASWDDPLSTVRGTITLRSLSTPATYAVFNISSAITDNGTWDTYTVTYVSGSGTLANNEPVSLSYSRTGDVGPTGSTGATGPSGTGTAEKAYASITTNFTGIGTGLNDVTGLSVTFTASTRPVVVNAWIPSVACLATSGATISWYITNSANTVQTSGQSTCGTVLAAFVGYLSTSTLISCRLSLTNSTSYTFKVRAQSTNGSSTTAGNTLFASATSPAYLHVIEV